MYPYDFEPTRKGLNPEEVFAVMPFSTAYDKVFERLIEPAVKSTATKMGRTLTAYRTKGDTRTTSGWLEVLEHLSTAQVVLGVLTKQINANVHYELGIAHATQPIRRQVLIAEDSYKPQFDTKDLIFMRYMSDNPDDSANELAQRIETALVEWDVEQERMVRHAIAKISPFDFQVVTFWAGQGHFAICTSGSGPSDYESHVAKVYGKDKRYMKGVFERHCGAVGRLQQNGLLGLSIRPQAGGVEYSYYWTDLGNLVLMYFDLIKEVERRQRYEEMPRHLRRVT